MSESILYQIIDDCLGYRQIDKLLDEAILLVDVMRDEGYKMYPECLKRLFPNETEEFWRLGSAMLNDLASDKD